MRKWLLATAMAGAAAVPAALAGESVRPGGAAPIEPGYRERSAAATTAEARYALGLWCRDQGLLAESRAEFQEAVRIEPAHAAARAELGESKVDGRWVASEEAMKAKGLVRHDGRWMLPEERAALLRPKEEREHLAREESRARSLLETMAAGEPRAARIAREALGSIADGAKVQPLAFALRAADASVRRFAAAELGRIRDRRAFRPLVHRALVDPEASVRADCIDAAKGFGDGELLAPLARAFLSNGNAAVRGAAAEAMGRAGDVRGVQYLIYAIEGHGGGSRSHIYVANQLSFIQDFDVEVAQTAFIADPIVGVLQEGISLDVKLIGTEWYATGIERQAIYGALTRLTGQSLGEDTAAWGRWYRENRARLTAATK